MADDLALAVYEATQSFPREEQFGLRAQMRRAGVSIVSNIVEGCARRGESEYLHFLDMSFGSLRELHYQVSLARRLGYFKENAGEILSDKCVETSKVLAALIRSLRRTD